MASLNADGSWVPATMARIKVSVGSGLELQHCITRPCDCPYGNVAIQDLTPALSARQSRREGASRSSNVRKRPVLAVNVLAGLALPSAPQFLRGPHIISGLGISLHMSKPSGLVAPRVVL